MKLRSLLRRFLRDRFGLSVSPAKYCPTGTERKIYETYLGPDRVRTIFDVGANVGQTAEGFQRAFPVADIYSFEPFQRNFEVLQEVSSRFPRIRGFQLALSDASGPLTVFTDSVPHSQWNSLAPWRQKELRNGSGVSQEAITRETGDQFCAAHGVERISILKVDTEGHDLEVLQGFKRMLSGGRVDSVLIEVGFAGDDGHGDFQQINTYLLMQAHMRLVGFYDISHLASGKCDYANALFVTKKT